MKFQVPIEEINQVNNKMNNWLTSLYMLVEWWVQWNCEGYLDASTLLYLFIRAPDPPMVLQPLLPPKLLLMLWLMLLHSTPRAADTGLLANKSGPSFSFVSMVTWERAQPPSQHHNNITTSATTTSKSLEQIEKILTDKKDWRLLKFWTNYSWNNKHRNELQKNVFISSFQS